MKIPMDGYSIIRIDCREITRLAKACQALEEEKSFVCWQGSDDIADFSGRKRKVKEVA